MRGGRALFLDNLGEVQEIKTLLSRPKTKTLRLGNGWLERRFRETDFHDPRRYPRALKTTWCGIYVLFYSDVYRLMSLYC